GDLGFADPAAAMRRIARTLETAMGGSSGVLLAILATAAGRSLETDGRADWSGALAEGIAAVQHHGGAAEGDRTMLDALIPAQRALAEGDGVVVPAAVAQAAAAGAEATATLTARAGRAAYVPDSATQGSPDAGPPPSRSWCEHWRIRSADRNRRGPGASRGHSPVRHPCHDARQRAGKRRNVTPRPSGVGRGPWMGGLKDGRAQGWMTPRGRITPQSPVGGEEGTRIHRARGAGPRSTPSGRAGCG
ncbi:DAK2 domain-containing protein, partial [Nesterenkonia sp. PF2B19]|uniref:DAK2 domain-containing protein n=1 Tax=Nesterenkonia sp. PF2B19 TaxID=1881858 RepID=UPI000A250A4B